MAEDKPPQELLIIKRTRGGSDHGHGGAWKIAFADFMTAMMALFLVLWLISATNEKTKASLARYFNPVKLVDMTIQKRGLNDPQEHQAENAVDNAPPPSRARSPASQDGKVATPRGARQRRHDSSAAYLPTHSEAALFRDPYAVLAEIEATGGTVKSPQADHSNVGAAASFQDPFQTVAPEPPKSTPPQPASASGAAPTAAPPPATPVAAVPKPASALPVPRVSKPAVTASVAPHENALAPAKNASAAAVQENSPQQAKKLPDVASATMREAELLRQEIAKALGKSAAKPNVEVASTSRGILISLTDGIDYAMFAIGSAEPQPRTVRIMKKIAHILARAKGGIIISGHTDGRRYRSRTYDNWRLSTARAQMALYMLVRGGLDERRIERIEGAADHELKVPSDPLAAQNRRIEILLQGAAS